MKCCSVDGYFLAFFSPAISCLYVNDFFFQFRWASGQRDWCVGTKEGNGAIRVAIVS